MRKKKKQTKKPSEKQPQNKITFTVRCYPNLYHSFLMDLYLGFLMELMTLGKYNIQKYAGMYNNLSQALITFLYLTPFVDGKVTKKVNE